MAKERQDGDGRAGPSERLVALDAYRGFTMLMMVSAGMGMKYLERDPTWGWLADQFEHRRWEGCTFWDLIQPSFMFIVGAAMPFSFAIRQAKGEGWAWQFLHAVKRACLLIVIGIFLDSYPLGFVQVQFIRVLQQIAIGYLIAFLVLHLGPAVQAVTVVFLLGGHTAAYLLYGRATGHDPWTAPPLEPGTYLDNVGTFLDSYLHLPLSPGHYVTFNAVSAAATILLGVLAGELLRSSLSPRQKVLAMVGAGLAGWGLGWALSGGDGWLPVSFAPLVPMIKRLWTSSFAVYAAGWTFLMLAGFYFVIEVLRLRAWSFPLVVVGMNSIAIYVAASLFRSLVVQSLYLVASLVYYVFPANAAIHWGLVVTGRFRDGIAYSFPPILHAFLAVVVFWLFCFWLYRHKIFFKV